MASVVVDTSVWINHFRENNQALVDLLEADAVLMHPMVVAEIACGTPPLRLSTLSDLKELQKKKIKFLASSKVRSLMTQNSHVLSKLIWIL